MLNLNNYDVLLMDLWGVLYDGHHLYPGALETLHKLRDLKKDVIFFSNVPRRKSTIQENVEYSYKLLLLLLIFYWSSTQFRFLRPFFILSIYSIILIVCINLYIYLYILS